jgi:putative ABC transport system permease protein
VIALPLLGLMRAPLQTVARMLALAAAVALLGAMILFVGHSLETMSASAVHSVPLDWQGPVASYAAAMRVAREVARQPGVLYAAPVATAPFSGIVHVGAAGTIRSGNGAILAVPPDYARRFHTFRFLRGSLRPGAIVFDQQLAATLQVQPGDTVTLASPGRDLQLRVSGVALVTAPDVLFQPLNPLLGPVPAQPPADIAILPVATLARVAGAHWQVQARVDPAALTGSPAHALKRATQIRNAVERSLTGQVVFVDNLSDSLSSAVGDALYAETLFIMLAVPGALVGLALAYLAALGTADRDRRELALLRARGASGRNLLLVAMVESVAIGLVAGGIGTAGALLAVHVAGTAGGIGWMRVGLAFGFCTALAFAGALAARVVASLAVLRVNVSEGRRRGVRRADRPLWQRLYLDVACLAVSGSIYWLTTRTGFSAVINPDSNPTLSLSVYMFFAPALLWLGGALLVIRLRGRAFGWMTARIGRTQRIGWRRFLLVSAGRRAAALNRGVLVVGLLLAFGVSLAVFTATYDQQARVDAQLTLGADVVATAPPGMIKRRGLEHAVAAIGGVAGTTAVDHSYAYVGPDLQDIFGIDPVTLTRGTTLHDSYFLGGGARQILQRLRSRPSGVLVAKETISDYSLGLGDLLRLRVLDRVTGRFRVVPFHVVGVVQEFPAAPRDSFMVANLAYLERVTHGQGPNVLLVKTSSDPPAVARRIAAATKTDGTLVKNIRQQVAQTVSSITTVDLSGISGIEEAFAILLASAATAMFVSVALAERRQEFATMAALGARLRAIAAFLWSEAAIVLVVALAFAALLGWLLAEMLVAMLQHVFDPPPDQLAVPWGYLAELFGAALLGAALATAAAAAGIRRLPLGALLREE